jgi:hypothetical protein
MNNNFRPSTLRRRHADASRTCTWTSLFSMHRPRRARIAYWSRRGGDTDGRRSPHASFSTHADPVAGPTRPLTVYRVTCRSPARQAADQPELHHRHGAREVTPATLICMGFRFVVAAAAPLILPLSVLDARAQTGANVLVVSNNAVPGSDQLRSATSSAGRRRTSGCASIPSRPTRSPARTSSGRSRRPRRLARRHQAHDRILYIVLTRGFRSDRRHDRPLRHDRERGLEAALLYGA